MSPLNESAHHGGDSPHHLTPLPVYFGVWLALLVGTGLTIGAAFIDLGFVNVPLMIGIACVKSALVALFFMHLLYDEKFNLIVFLGGIGFVIIFFAFTLMDPLTRGWVNERERDMINPEMFRTAAEDSRRPRVYQVSPGVPDTATTITLPWNTKLSWRPMPHTVMATRTARRPGPGRNRTPSPPAAGTRPPITPLPRAKPIIDRRDRPEAGPPHEARASAMALTSSQGKWLAPALPATIVGSRRFRLDLGAPAFSACWFTSASRFRDRSLAVRFSLRWNPSLAWPSAAMHSCFWRSTSSGSTRWAAIVHALCARPPPSRSAGC